MRIKTLTIKRSEWGRGPFTLSGGGPRRLLNLEGFKCCLGFFSLACGVPAKEILGASGPDNLKKDDQEKIPQLVFLEEHTALTIEAVKINDDPFIEEAEREQKLSELFRKKGVKLKFVD